jgi:uncharacterized membrane-anchored protein
MKVFSRLACLAGFLLLVNSAAADQGVYPKTDEEKRAAFEALNWLREPKGYSLDASHGQIQLPQGKILLLGADAQRYSWLISGVEFPSTEAVMSNEAGNADVYYEWRDAGYVSDSDWSDVDADEMLAGFKESTEASNKERAANGFKPMEVVGWLQPPTYDAATHTASYSLELKDDDSHWANVVALRLGRGGYSELTWVGAIDVMESSGGRPALLNTALDIHAFDEGHRYADYQDGDKVAAFGIAGLVATALGLKLGGKGLIAAIIAFVVAGKKIIIPAVLLGGAGLAKYWRRIFNRGGAES